MGINNRSECINFVKKNHYCSENEQVTIIKTINFSDWLYLPPVYMQSIINKQIDIGVATYHKNSNTHECKISGIVIMHKQIDDNINSIVVDVYTLKQIMEHIDDFYSNMYYLFEIVNNRIYVKENWDIYENLLHVGDRLITIENTPVNLYMHHDETNKDLHFETWITMMYMKNETLVCKVNRNNQIVNISIPRIPLSNIIQYKYYSENPTEITLEKMYTNPTDINVKRVYDTICNNPKKLFN